MKSSPTRIPGAVLVGLILAVILDTVIQVTWKMAVSRVSDGMPLAAAATTVFTSAYFWVAMGTFGVQLVNWLRVLARADLSFAQPFTALSYLTVLTVSSHTLHEHLSGSRLAGVGLILVGVYCISRTPFRTPPAPAPSRPLPP